MIEEFLFFRGHETAVDAQHFAKLRRFQQLQLLKWRLHLLASGGAIAKAAMRGEMFLLPAHFLLGHSVQRSLMTRCGHADIAAHQLLAQHALGGKGVDDALHQLARLARVVIREIADIDVDGDAACLWPGVDGQMRLCQQHGSRHPARLALIGRKLHPCVIHQSQTRGRSLVAA